MYLFFPDILFQWNKISRLQSRISIYYIRPHPVKKSAEFRNIHTVGQKTKDVGQCSTNQSFFLLIQGIKLLSDKGYLYTIILIIIINFECKY